MATVKPRKPSARRPARVQPPSTPTRAGRVIARHGPVLTVACADGTTCECVARGKGKGTVIGDRVRFIEGADTEMAEGLVVEIEPRDRVLVRANALGRREQVLAANLDHIFVVVTIEPPLREGLIDRYVVAAHQQGIDASIVFNKVDLLTDADAIEDVGDRLAPYPALGYPVYFVSAAARKGLGDLRTALQSKCSIFVGHSGVGKTSLLNALDPGLGERVQQLSDSSGRGRHTTSASMLHTLPGGGEVIDSPGVRGFGLWDLEPEALRDHFVEMAQRAGQCRFKDCQHLSEPGCAVLAAVESGEIAQSRHDSYVRIRESLEFEDGNRFF